MKASDYFKKTFVFVFVFSLAYRMVFQLFDGLDSFSLKFLTKTFLVSLLTALILGILNYFVKFEIFNKSNKKQ
jgi:uncharacterized membrane protein YvlD (DUF360 family)